MALRKGYCKILQYLGGVLLRFRVRGCVEQSRIEHLFEKAKGDSLPFFTHYGEVTDLNNIVSVA